MEVLANIFNVIYYYFPAWYLILVMIIFATGLLYLIGDKFHAYEAITPQFRKYIGKGIYAISIVVMLLGIIIALTHYSKTFNIKAFDDQQNVLDNVSIYKNGVPVKNEGNTGSNNEIVIRNTDIPAYVRVDHKALSKTNKVELDYFYKYNSISAVLEKNNTIIYCNDKLNGFTVAKNRKISTDSGGIDLHTTNRYLDNYILVDNDKLLNADRFEIRTRAMFHDDRGSLDIQIANGIRLLLGEGNLGSMRLETNNTGMLNDWTLVDTRQLEHGLEKNSQFTLSIVVLKRGQNQYDILVNIFNRKVAEKTYRYENIQLNMSPSVGIKLGCINKNKTKTLRMLDIEIIDNKKNTGTAGQNQTNAT